MLLLLSLAVAINAAELRPLGRWAVPLRFDEPHTDEPPVVEDGLPQSFQELMTIAGNAEVAAKVADEVASTLNSKRRPRLSSESSDDKSTGTGPSSEDMPSRHPSQESSPSDSSQKSWSDIVRDGLADTNRAYNNQNMVKRVELAARDEVAGLLLKANAIFIDGNNCMQSKLWGQGFIQEKSAFYTSENELLGMLKSRARVHAHRAHVVFDGKSDQKQRDDIAPRKNLEVTWAVDRDDGMAERWRTADDKIVIKVRQFVERVLHQGYDHGSKPTLLLITDDSYKTTRRNSLVDRVRDETIDRFGNQAIEVKWMTAGWLVKNLLKKAQK